MILSPKTQNKGFSRLKHALVINFSVFGVGVLETEFSVSQDVASCTLFPLKELPPYK